MSRHRSRHGRDLRGDPRCPAHLPRAQTAREPRQDRCAGCRQREGRPDRTGARAGRLRVHAGVATVAADGPAPLRLMAARAGIVVTGTEVLTGRVRDRNGPWLSDRMLELGVELAHISICGDRPEDMTAQLAFMRDQGVDLVITSGGLGPTADDLTTEMVAGFTGRPLLLDDDL